MRTYDVIVIGGGPAGLAAAISVDKSGARVLLIEREARLGGILKQCIHDGFGLITFNEKLTGPEYAGRYIEMLKTTKIEISLLTFVTDIAKKEDNTFELTIVTKEGIDSVIGNTVIFATGCRERTSKQIFIQGTRPSGVFTAGTAQYLVNILGKLPTKRCVILGSGDIGLIMARRLTLEGAEVVGVYEAKSTPSGLTRNIHQCLLDFNIPLHLSHTVSKIFGKDRVTAVEIVKVDEKMNKIEGSEQIVECDAVILSVGLIPENEVAEKLGMTINNSTKGALIDNNFMTDIKGAFSCGNALFVNDLVDYVSLGAEIAGKNAASYSYGEQNTVDIKTDKNFLSLIPHRLDLNTDISKTIVFFRSGAERADTDVILKIDGVEVLRKKYKHLKPPEMEKLEIDFTKYNVKAQSAIEFLMEDVVK